MIETSRSLTESGGTDTAEEARYYHVDPSWFEENALSFEDVVRAGYFRSVAGIKRIKTPLGQDVDLIEGGRYQISETSIVVTSDDPLAP